MHCASSIFLSAITQWMSKTYFFKLNEDETEVLLLTTITITSTIKGCTLFQARNLQSINLGHQSKIHQR